MTAPDPAHHPLPWLRIVAVAVVMAIGVSLLWIVIRQFDDTNIPVDDPSPGPSIAATDPPPPSTATPSTAGTPEPPAPAWPAGSLPAMLEYAPDPLADDSLPLNDVARYADIGGWMAANGIAPPASLDDRALPAWEDALAPLTLPASLTERGLDPVWSRTYGFDLTQVSQILVIGQAPDYVMIMRGEFDPEAMQAAWVASGYQSIEVEGHTVWSLFPAGDQIDLSAPESRPAMGTLNNVILLDDGTLVTASRMSRLGSTLSVIDGNAPSLAANDDVAALLVPGTGVDTLASAVIAKGSLVQGTDATMPVVATPGAGAPPVLSIATPGTDSGMPEVRLVLLGLPLPAAAEGGAATPVAVPPPRLVMLLVMEDAEAAAQTVREVRARLEHDHSPVTGEPYLDRIANPRYLLASAGDHPVVVVIADLADGPADWLAILGDRDLGFAFWLPEP